MTTTLSPLPNFAVFYDSKAKTAELMFKYGGSFAQGLALALNKADRDNAQRIYTAFPELLQPYAPGGKFHNA